MQDNQKLPYEAMVIPCDLWVLPTPLFSRWFTHLDWYLNWQMCKGLAYGGLHLPAETYRVAEEYSVPLRDRSNRSGEMPLLIASRGRVPADKCLVVDADRSLKEWLGAVRERVDSLGVTKVRVFLPTGATVKEAEKAWKNSYVDVQFSPDLETTA